MRFNLLILIFLFFFSVSQAGKVAQVVDDLKAKTGKLLKDTGKVLQEVGQVIGQDKEETKKKHSDIVSEAWKKELEESFNKNIDFLRQIIINGETKKDELKDYNLLFDELKKWVDHTLLKTKYRYGPNYTSLMKKKNAIEMVVESQKEATRIIDEKSEHIGFDKKLAPQVRLFVLYEINAVIQKTKTTIPEDKIEEIVDNSIKIVGKEYKEFGVDLAIVQNLVSKLKQIKEELILQDEILFKLENIIKDKFITKEKKILNLELLLNRQAEVSKKKIEDQFKGNLKEMKKTNLDLELKLKKNEKDFHLKLEDKFQERLSEIKKILTGKQRANMELQLLLKQIKRERNRLHEKVKKLKGQLATQAEPEKTDIEQELDFEKSALDGGDKRLGELLKNIETVEQEFEKEKLSLEK